MPTASQRVLARLLLLLWVAIAALAHAELEVAALHQAFDERFRGRMAEETVPGAAAAIVHRGQLAALRALQPGRIALDQAVDRNVPHDRLASGPGH